MFEDDGSSSVLVFRTSRGGLYELPAHLGKSDSCSDCQSMCLVGNVELASDAGNCLQRAQLQERQMLKKTKTSFCHAETQDTPDFLLDDPPPQRSDFFRF